MTGERESLYVALIAAPPEIRIRVLVSAFAAMMERELIANAHKNTHPLSHDFGHLLSELRVHVEKFATAPTEEHAADIANLAMLALAEVRDD